jgi:hypothetical protein
MAVLIDMWAKEGAVNRMKTIRGSSVLRTQFTGPIYCGTQGLQSY